MRILVLTSRLPYPPDRGDRLRAYHILKTLARDHELILLSFAEHAGQREQVAALEEICSEVRVVVKSRLSSTMSVVGGWWRRLPLQALYYRSRAMSDLVARTLDEHSIDAAYIHLFRMAPYLERAGAPYRIVDLTDIVSEEVRASLPYRSLPSWLLYLVERGRIERYEAAVADAAEEVWLISERERRTLLDRCPAANARVIPNGVDLEVFRPLDDDDDPSRIVFSGHMGVPHNVDAAVHLAEDILPAVRRRVEGCRLRIVGADPSRRVCQLDRLPGVEVAGFVPDLNRELNRAAVFVAPLRFAAGVQNKVLEAMAAGRAVITSPRVAEGLGATSDRELLVARDADRFADLTAAVLGDRRIRSRLGTAARRFVAERFTWNTAAERVHTIAFDLSPP